MTGLLIGRRILRFGSLPSTMDEAARLGQGGEPEGAVVVAREQTAGRGRGGRPWLAPPGTALLCSVLLRPEVPPVRLPVFSLLAGVAVAGAIEETTGLSCRLKWPNDVWLKGPVPGQKVAGILLTSRTGPAGVSFVVAGIGINVTARQDQLPDGATSLLAAGADPPDLETLLGALLTRLNRAYREFKDSGGHPNLDPWRQRAALVGARVTVADGSVRHEGEFSGIDDDGALLLRVGPDETRRLVAGELTRGPRLAPPA